MILEGNTSVVEASQIRVAHVAARLLSPRVLQETASVDSAGTAFQVPFRAGNAARWCLLSNDVETSSSSPAVAVFPWREADASRNRSWLVLYNAANQWGSSTGPFPTGVPPALAHAVQDESDCSRDVSPSPVVLRPEWMMPSSVAATAGSAASAALGVASAAASGAGDMQLAAAFVDSSCRRRQLPEDPPTTPPPPAAYLLSPFAAFGAKAAVLGNIGVVTTLAVMQLGLMGVIDRRHAAAVFFLTSSPQKKRSEARGGAATWWRRLLSYIVSLTRRPSRGAALVWFPRGTILAVFFFTPGVVRYATMALLTDVVRSGSASWDTIVCGLVGYVWVVVVAYGWLFTVVHREVADKLLHLAPAAQAAVQVAGRAGTPHTGAVHRTLSTISARIVAAIGQVALPLGRWQPDHHRLRIGKLYSDCTAVSKRRWFVHSAVTLVLQFLSALPVVSRTGCSVLYASMVFLCVGGAGYLCLCPTRTYLSAVLGVIVHATFVLVLVVSWLKVFDVLDDAAIDDAAITVTAASLLRSAHALLLVIWEARQGRQMKTAFMDGARDEKSSSGGSHVVRRKDRSESLLHPALLCEHQLSAAMLTVAPVEETSVDGMFLVLPNTTDDHSARIEALRRLVTEVCQQETIRMRFHSSALL